MDCLSEATITIALGSRPITFSPACSRYSHPAAFRGGVAYVSLTPRWTEVKVVDLEGESPRVVVRDVNDSAIAVSPDGAWLAFRRNRRLWKIPMAAGTPTQLLQELSSSPAWSPKGDRLAVLIGDPETYNGNAAVISAADGKRVTQTPGDILVTIGSAPSNAKLCCAILVSR